MGAISLKKLGTAAPAQPTGKPAAAAGAAAPATESPAGKGAAAPNAPKDGRNLTSGGSNSNIGLPEAKPAKPLTPKPGEADCSEFDSMLTGCEVNITPGEGETFR